MTREEAIKKITENNPSASTFYADVIVGALQCLGLIPIDGKYNYVKEFTPMQAADLVSPKQPVMEVDLPKYSECEDVVASHGVLFRQGVYGSSFYVPFGRIELAIEAAGYKIVKLDEKP